MNAENIEGFVAKTTIAFKEMAVALGLIPSATIDQIVYAVKDTVGRSVASQITLIELAEKIKSSSLNLPEDLQEAVGDLLERAKQATTSHTINGDLAKHIKVLMGE